MSLNTEIWPIVNDAAGSRKRRTPRCQALKHWGVVKFPATKCHVINFALVAACSPKPSWYEGHCVRNDRERLVGHPGREFEAPSGLRHGVLKLGLSARR